MNIDPEERELSALRAYLSPESRVVEIGCGDGRLTRRYSRMVASVIAVDPDEARIAVFRAAGPGSVDIRAMAVEQLALADGSVDVALFSWAL